MQLKKEAPKTLRSRGFLVESAVPQLPISITSSKSAHKDIKHSLTMY